jgi:hypothetical protein
LTGGAATAGGEIMAGGATLAGGGAVATGADFGGASATTAGAGFGASLAGGGSDAGATFAAWSGLISMLACCAKVSEVSGTIGPKRWNAGASAGLADAAGAAGACEASAAGDRDAGGLSDCWKATSIM